MKKKSATMGYILIFKDEFSEKKLKEKINKSKNREFYVFRKSDLDFIGKWDNREQCQKDINIRRSTITRNLDSNNKRSRNEYLFYYSNSIPSKLKYKTKDVI